MPLGEGGSRFRHLPLDVDSVPLSQPNKKYKTNLTPLYKYPDLPTIQTVKNPKFLVISAKSNDNPISSLNPFVLKKSIDEISKEYEQISQLRDGNLLILVKSQKIVDIFLKVNNLAKCPVTVKPHDKLNESKGIAYAPCLINVPEKEIIKEMTSQGVTDIYKFTKNEEGKQRVTGLMLFTFNLYQAPKSVEIGFYNAKITEYVPNPMRCRNCQILGHTSKRCNGEAKCDTCSFSPHVPEPCTRVKCANCSLAHASSSKTCPAYKQSKEILTIKTQKKCSMAEAKRIYKDQYQYVPPPLSSSTSDSFSETAKLALKKQSQFAQPPNTNNDQTKAPKPINNASIHNSEPMINRENNVSTTVNNTTTTISHTTLSNTISKNSTPIQLSYSPNAALDNLPTISNLSDTPSISNHLKKTTSLNQPTNNQPQSPKSTNPNKKPTNSPISEVTQSLIEKKQYFVRNPDPDDVEMH
ncbi:uncharacterized protein LOC129916217 [Episyrphus balteatus]|uniref:uncharacterized protein LOC129916217 n=1 Tax=Episyrphus balteatus TaxID=286459 RepID=UPI00248693C8|nr:uncharacterized protein LOC129916217 [Episyrphus balteatus]